MSPTRKKVVSLISIFGATIVFSSALFIFGNLDSWQEKVTDRFFTETQPKQPIVILAIDNESLNKIGQWPWPRAVFANALSHLSKAQAIGIDINFSESSRVGSADDSLLANAFKTTGSTTPIILPYEIEARGRIANRPLALFQPYITEGFVNISVDTDTILRSMSAQINTKESFSSLLAHHIKNNIAPETFRLNYRGKEKTFLTIPFIDVVNNKVPERIFEHAVVLIGATAPDLHDTVHTPFGIMPGIEAHANAIETILDGNFLQPLPTPLTILVIACVDLIALLAIVFIKHFWLLVVSLGGLLIAINALGFTLFSFTIIFPSVYVSLSLVFISILLISFQYISESQEKRFIRKSFQHYISKELVDELVQHPEKLVLGGERRHLSILFSDIRGFTTISEAMTPEALTLFMSEYFEVVSNIILENRGILDKYIGDAVFAFWGAPVYNPNHTKDACTVAIAMIEQVKKQNIVWQKRNLPIIEIGIGINTGDVVVGNMGSQKRFNYGILGDEVNFASRLEGLTKEYGVTCIISETTKNEIENIKTMHVRELDFVRVKGKKEPKKIFQLITTPMSETLEKQLAFFETGRSAYTAGNWDEAIAAFSQALALGSDGPSAVFLSRCQVFKHSPPEPWTGIYDFKTK